MKDSKSARSGSPAQSEGQSRRQPPETGADSVPQSGNKLAGETQGRSDREPNLPAGRYASEPIVERAIRGLMRVESRRRWRTAFRRVVWMTALVAIGYGLWYLFGDRLPGQWLTDLWDDLMLKLEPVFEASDSQPG